MEEGNKASEPEIDLIDKKGHEEKLEVLNKVQYPQTKFEVYKEKEETIKKEEIVNVKAEEKRKETKAQKKRISQVILDIYDKQYKKLTIATLLLVVLAILYIGFQVAVTGSFIQKDVSLKGGVTLTITTEKAMDILSLEKSLKSKFAKNDISVRSVKETGRQIGIIVLADIDGTNKEELNDFISAIEADLGYTLSEDMYSTEIMGSSLGASFFRETIIAMVGAFILMSIVIFIYFREAIPALAVILCCFSDIIEALAVVNLIGMKVSTGGIAAFLMLIGYAVDENMLLSTRVLKRKEGSIMERTLGAMSTGMMMTLTTLVALAVGIIFIKSGIVRQIMLIIFIGLLFDIINTWIQNVGVLRYYLEKKKKDG